MKSPLSADITPNARNPKLSFQTRKQALSLSLLPPTVSEVDSRAARPSKSTQTGTRGRSGRRPSHLCSRTAARTLGTLPDRPHSRTATPPAPSGPKSNRHAASQDPQRVTATAARHSPPMGARAAAGSEVREGRCFRKGPKKSKPPEKRCGSLGHAASPDPGLTLGPLGLPRARPAASRTAPLLTACAGCREGADTRR